MCAVAFRVDPHSCVFFFVELVIDEIHLVGNVGFVVEIERFYKFFAGRRVVAERNDTVISFDVPADFFKRIPYRAVELKQARKDTVFVSLRNPPNAAAERLHGYISELTTIFVVFVPNVSK